MNSNISRKKIKSGDSDSTILMSKLRSAKIAKSANSKIAFTTAKEGQKKNKNKHLLSQTKKHKKKKINHRDLEVTYLQRIVQRIFPFYQLDFEISLAIKNLTDGEFNKLTTLTKRTYYLDFQRLLARKNKKIIKTYSKQNLNSKIIISSLNPNDTKIGSTLDKKKYVIQTRKLSKSYFSSSVRTAVLTKISLDIKRNSFLTILGPSGSGKTTLLNLMSGLDTATEGDVFVNGINLSVLNDRDLTYFRKDNVGFVFQQYNLLQNLNVMENIEVGAALAKSRDDKFIKNIVKLLGLDTHIKKYPYQLSGGEQQRVSIARALAKKPSILFCDEPTGALDQVSGKIVLKILHKINTTTSTTVILITHNRRLAEFSDVIMEIKAGHIHSFAANKNKKTISTLNW